MNCSIQALLLVVLLACFNGTTSMNYLLCCGPSNISSSDGRDWSSDTYFSDGLFNTTTTSTADTLDADVTPFSTARVFSKSLTYRFRVSPGPKFIRLFFAKSISVADAYLTAQAHLNSDDAQVFLLLDYSAYYDSHGAIKEFYVHVNSSLLQLTLSPSRPNSYAFINGIEVVSVPEHLYKPITRTTSCVLQTLYRLNVGGREITSIEDSGSMYRGWENDAEYAYLEIGKWSPIPPRLGVPVAVVRRSIKYSAATPNYTAPALVYETFRSLDNTDDELRTSLTWRFQVDLGFSFILRLHWCEIWEINSTNYRVFDVYINDQLADRAIDVFALVGSSTPIYRDYLVHMDRPDQTQSTGLMQLLLRPSAESHPKMNDVLLNALEIFKTNGPDGTIGTSKRSKFIHGIIAFSIGGFILVAFVTCFFILRPIIAKKQTSTSRKSINNTKFLTSPIVKRSNKNQKTDCDRFSLAQLKLATDDFNEGLIIGRGGFGNVYRAILHGKNEILFKAAIKRLNPSSKQGAHEFKNEIELLSKIRHVHLVSLLGYCDENGEMILVYDYMEHGTVCDHLYKTNNSPLSWTQRLSICLGAAKGLHYLHSGVGQVIIHRDIKSSNILLDENWVPKLSDFGLSKLGPIGGHLHVSTAVKGTFGYMDPDYYMLQQLTVKSDVYSFGVVLFEVLCGRAAVNPNLPFEEVNVAMWARSFQQRGALDVIIDPNLTGQIVPECLRAFGEIAERCVREHRTARPTMADVVWSLESAIQLQQYGDIMSTGSIFSHDLSQLSSIHESQVALSTDLVPNYEGKDITTIDSSR